MPWKCVPCDKTLSDELSACPGCKGSKSAWTLVSEKTRTFQVSGKRVEYLRGKHTEAHPADAQPADELVPATAITVLEASYLAKLAEDGLLPPSRYVVVARLWPRRAKDKAVLLEVNFEEDERGVHELSFPQETEPALREDGSFDVRFVFFHGEHDPAPAFEGIHAVDLSERHENPQGVKFAPSVDATALKKDPHPLPTQELGLRVRFAWPDGTPVKGRVRVSWTTKLVGELDAEGSYQVPGAAPGDALRVRLHQVEQHFLSAQFFDRTGQVPAAGLRFQCGDHKSQTDGNGLALVTAVPCDDLELEFQTEDGEGLGKTIVPAVHDPQIVVKKCLAFLDVPQATIGAPRQIIDLRPPPAEGEEDSLQRRYPSGQHPDDADDPEDGPEEDDDEGDAADPHPAEDDA